MLLLDYDGVLLNSLKEVAAVSYLAFDKNKDSLQNFDNLETINPNYYKTFCKNRFHCQPAGDFLVLADYILSNEEHAEDVLISKEKFNSAVLTFKLSSKQRKELFFKTRNKIIKLNLSSWLSLHQTYKEIWQEAKKFEENIILLTNKDKAATLRTSKYFGLNIKEKNIYSGDTSSKSENLVKILERFKSENSFPGITFIDDSIKNLISINEFSKKENINFTPLLADWGYLGPDDKQIAISNSIQIISENEFKLKDLNGRLYLSEN